MILNYTEQFDVSNFKETTDSICQAIKKENNRKRENMKNLLTSNETMSCSAVQNEHICGQQR